MEKPGDDQNEAVEGVLRMLREIFKKDPSKSQFFRDYLDGKPLPEEVAKQVGEFISQAMAGNSSVSSPSPGPETRRRRNEPPREGLN